MPSYYPQCKVRLKVRLEDNSRGILPPALRETQADAGPESFGSGAIDDVQAVANEFLVIGQDFVPLSCTLELNNYRKADSAKLSFDLDRLPLDPRLVRAMTVQVFMGVFTAADLAAAVGPAGATGGLIPDVPDERTGSPDSYGGYTNELFRGFADKHSIQINDTDQTVEIECRDMTGELIDAEVPPNQLQDLPGFLRLDEVVQLILTGDGLADKQQDARVDAEQTKKSGRRRKKLLAEARKLKAEAADAQADGEATKAQAFRAQAKALREQANALQADAAKLPAKSRRFGLPGFRGARVVNEVRDPVTGEIAELPTLDEVRPKAWLDSRGTARKGRRRASGNKQKQGYWDFLADLVQGAGYILDLRTPRGQDSPQPGERRQLVAVEIVITNPRTYYRQSTTAGDLTPTPSSVRRFVYGGNIAELSIARNLAGTKTPTIQTSAFDQATGTRYTATYPPLRKNNRPSPTGNGDREDIKVINLDQVAGSSPEQIVESLTQAAAAIYERLSRGDLEVEIKTDSLAALPENLAAGERADLFALRPKDPISVEIPPEDRSKGVVSSALILGNASVADRVAAGRRAGLDQSTAEILARAGSSQYLQSEFRTQMIVLQWSNDPGSISAAIKALNYIDVRDSVQITDARYQALGGG